MDPDGLGYFDCSEDVKEINDDKSLLIQIKSISKYDYKTELKYYISAMAGSLILTDKQSLACEEEGTLELIEKQKESVLFDHETYFKLNEPFLKKLLRADQRD